MAQLCRHFLILLQMRADGPIHLVDQMALDAAFLHIDDIVAVDAVKPAHGLSLDDADRDLRLVAVKIRRVHADHRQHFQIEPGDPGDDILHLLPLERQLFRIRHMLQLTAAAAPG